MNRQYDFRHRAIHALTGIFWILLAFALTAVTIRAQDLYGTPHGPTFLTILIALYGSLHLREAYLPTGWLSPPSDNT